MIRIILGCIRSDTIYIVVAVLAFFVSITTAILVPLKNKNNINRQLYFFCLVVLKNFIKISNNKSNYYGKYNKIIIIKKL